MCSSSSAGRHGAFVERLVERVEPARGPSGDERHAILARIVQARGSLPRPTSSLVGVNATFVLTPGSSSFKLGRVERDEIVWGSMSTKGLPRQATWTAAWAAFRTRSGCALRTEVVASTGIDGNEVHGFWTADPRRSQPRRVSVELLPWLSSSILVLTTNPASGGVTSRLERLLPGIQSLRGSFAMGPR